ncbi:MAG: tetratricopeptide repeat protein [bacterium]|nr:tetratricopeptide repeat protein [Candidatus Sumerlaeota bacterium]
MMNRRNCCPSSWLLSVLPACLVLAGCVSPRYETVYAGLARPERVVSPQARLVPVNTNPMPLKDYAACALNEGRNDDALKLYKDALKQCPGDDQARLGLANAYYRMGWYSEACPLASAVIAHGGPFLPAASQLKIEMETASGNYDAARQAADVLAQWAERNGQKYTAIDAWLIASRLCSKHLDDAQGTFFYLNKAKALAGPADLEAAKRIEGCEKELKRTCYWARLYARQF